MIHAGITISPAVKCTNAVRFCRRNVFAAESDNDARLKPSIVAVECRVVGGAGQPDQIGEDIHGAD